MAKMQAERSSFQRTQDQRRPNVDSFGLFCTWPGLGYLADLCSGGTCWHMGCSHTFGIWQPPLFAGSAHPLCPWGSAFASQHSARLPAPTSPPSSVFQQHCLYFSVALTHHVGVHCFHLLTSPTGGWAPLHPVTPLDKCHLQAKQDSADPNRNETQN